MSLLKDKTDTMTGAWTFW